MWLAATDLLMEKLKHIGVDLNLIRAVSGSGQVEISYLYENVFTPNLPKPVLQQHGSVYWKTGAEKTLRNLNFNENLTKNLEVLFNPYCVCKVALSFFCLRTVFPFVILQFGWILAHSSSV